MTKRVNEFISRKELALQNAISDISKEEEQKLICEEAMKNLEAAISEGRRVLKTDEDALTALLNIRSESSGSSEIGSIEIESEPSSQAIHSDSVQDASNLISQLKDTIENQITKMQSDVRSLWDKVRGLELELSSWKYSHELSINALQSLNAYKSAIEKDMRMANRIFRPIWRMPPEAWARVFKFVVEETERSYLSSNDNTRLLPPFLSLSQVCRTWRHIILNEPNLSNLIYVAPGRMWTLGEYNLAAEVVKRSRSPFRVMTNLYHHFEYSDNGIQQFTRDGDWVETMSPNQDELVGEKEYELVADMAGDGIGYMQRMPCSPLSRPSSITLSSRAPWQYGHIFLSLFNSPTTKSLTIINEYPRRIPFIELAPIFPHLSKLKIFVKKFPSNMVLNGLLLPSLEELYLRHEEGEDLPRSVANVSSVGLTIPLPNLKVLGITAPGSYLFEHLRTSAMRRLILYEPTNRQGLSISFTEKAKALYRQIWNLEFESWGQPATAEESFGAVDALRDLVTEIRGIKTLKFSYSFVDGRALVSILGGSPETSGYETLTRLKELTLSHTTGITQDQCEAAKLLVKRLNIYV
jgi:hypothetical protein